MEDTNIHCLICGLPVHIGKTCAEALQEVSEDWKSEFQELARHYINFQKEADKAKQLDRDLIRAEVRAEIWKEIAMMFMPKREDRDW